MDNGHHSPLPMSYTGVHSERRDWNAYRYFVWPQKATVVASTLEQSLVFHPESSISSRESEKNPEVP